MVFLVLWCAALLAAALHALLRRQDPRGPGILRIFILYQLGLAWAVGGLLGFLGHAFRPEAVARTIGWPAHPFFQFELAAFELGYSLAALLGLRIREPRYWLGFVLAPGTFLLLSGLQHVREAVLHGNFAPYNFVIIAPDLLLPLSFLGLLAALRRREASAA